MNVRKTNDQLKNTFVQWDFSICSLQKVDPTGSKGINEHL